MVWEQWRYRGGVLQYYNLRWRTGISLICLPADGMYDIPIGYYVQSLWKNKLRRGVERYYKDKGGGGIKELHEMLAVVAYSGSVPSRGFVTWVT